MITTKITQEEFFKISGLCHIPSEFSDWFPKVNYKQNALDNIRKIAEFWHKNGRYPSQIAKNFEEKRLGNKLSVFKISRNGNSNWKWYPEYEKLAKKLKCHDMFKTHS